MYEVLSLALEAIDFETALHPLIGTHDGGAVLTPPFHQGASARLLRHPATQVLCLLVVFVRDGVNEDIQVAHALCRGGPVSKYIIVVTIVVLKPGLNTDAELGKEGDRVL